mmetsp:Transcript_50732/g.61175  ORF Transcript_50732/g.61175 Transcript_50732/m.61175 type:complete len:101 (-) Transcript_50732:79-381(-)
MIIMVYKDGHAPAHVLEELNRADLPEEVIREQAMEKVKREKEAARLQEKERKLEEFKMKQALQRSIMSTGGGDTSQLNKNKRDRRTIAEIQDDFKRAKHN